MEQHTVYIAIGSNLESPIEQAKQALIALNTHPDMSLLAYSSLYSSTPMGPQDQPDYINAVAKVSTHLSPIELLDATQKIENEHGRVRKERWGARTLDLDILLYNNEIITSERLTIPHYGMKDREFVIYPLAEIAPDLILPCQTKVAELKATLPSNSLAVVVDSTALQLQG